MEEKNSKKEPKKKSILLAIYSLGAFFFLVLFIFSLPGQHHPVRVTVASVYFGMFFSMIIFQESKMSAKKEHTELVDLLKKQNNIINQLNEKIETQKAILNKLQQNL